MARKMFLTPIILLVSIGISSVTSQVEYDSLILSEMWKRSSCCLENRLDSPYPNCDECSPTDAATEWTIHGLWPSDSTGANQVQDCFNPVRSINFKTYPADLQQEMNNFWPNYRHDGQNSFFWWHEWKKHGTCSRDLPQVNGHQDYFRLAIDTFKRFQVGKMLQAEGIIPSGQSYSINAVKNAVKKYTQNHEPMLTCIKKQGYTYLHQVYLCFTKQLTLKDCDTRSNCGRTFYYP